MTYEVSFGITSDPPQMGVHKLAKLDDLCEKHARRALVTSTDLIHDFVVPLTPVGVSGRLRQSIYSRVEGTGSNLKGIVGSTIAEREIYPKVMEFGRRPGSRMPPPNKLERWVHIVLKVPVHKAGSVAFVLARAIGRRGIKGKFFFKQGWQRSEPRVRKIMDEALRDITREMRQIWR